MIARLTLWDSIGGVQVPLDVFSLFWTSPGTSGAFFHLLCIRGYRTRRQLRRCSVGHHAPGKTALWQAPARRLTPAGRGAFYGTLALRVREASAVEYKGYLIEAFEEWPRRWFANVRRLDDQAIPGVQSPILRTFSVRPSKAAAIEFAKKVIDALPLV